MSRVATTCEQCGQHDDHPKVHMAGLAGTAVTKHHDCLSAAEKAMVADSSEVAAKIIEACEGGKRGADLLAHIEAVHAKGK